MTPPKLFNLGAKWILDDANKHMLRLAVGERINGEWPQWAIEADDMFMKARKKIVEDVA